MPDNYIASFDIDGKKKPSTCCCPRTPFTYSWRNYCTYVPNGNYTVVYRGATLQMCCKECVDIFLDSQKLTGRISEPAAWRNSARFSAVAHHQLVATEQARQTRCPLSGKPFAPEPSCDVAGVRVCFAMSAGRARVAALAMPERVNLVFSEEAFARGFTFTPAPQLK